MVFKCQIILTLAEFLTQGRAQRDRKRLIHRIDAGGFSVSAAIRFLAAHFRELSKPLILLAVIAETDGDKIGFREDFIVKPDAFLTVKRAFGHDNSLRNFFSKIFIFKQHEPQG